jgi:hypothetical protein
MYMQGFSLLETNVVGEGRAIRVIELLFLPLLCGYIFGDERFPLLLHPKDI